MEKRGKGGKMKAEVEGRGGRELPTLGGGGVEGGAGGWEGWNAKREGKLITEKGKEEKNGGDCKYGGCIARLGASGLRRLNLRQRQQRQRQRRRRCRLLLLMLLLLRRQLQLLLLLLPPPQRLRGGGAVCLQLGLTARTRNMLAPEYVGGGVSERRAAAPPHKVTTQMFDCTPSK